MPSYCNRLAGLRHPAGFIIIKGNYTYDKLSKVVLLDSFIIPFCCSKNRCRGHIFRICSQKF